MSDEMSDRMSDEMPDLVIKDMEFFRTGTAQFPAFGVRVYVKNIGTRRAEGPIPVKLFKTNNALPVGFGAIFPESISIDAIEPNRQQVVEWEYVGSVGTWAGYFLAVVDTPTRDYPMGEVEEGPTTVAENNNVFAISFPVK
ncbi:MAG: hypothetical protein V3S89_00515 [Desulfobacterales bacterium]